MLEHDLTRARELVKESGYDGRPIVLLQVTDKTFMNAAAVVTRQQLESIGFKVYCTEPTSGRPRPRINFHSIQFDVVMFSAQARAV
jgi:ABC-type transport system substrate-binding protein